MEHMSSKFLWLVAGITCAGACYGGLHLTAWTNHYPSVTEVTMWRAASVTLTVSGALYAMLAVLAVLLRMIDALAKFWNRCRGGDASDYL